MKFSQAKKLPCFVYNLSYKNMCPIKSNRNLRVKMSVLGK